MPLVLHWLRMKGLVRHASVVPSLNTRWTERDFSLCSKSVTNWLPLNKPGHFLGILWGLFILGLCCIDPHSFCHPGLFLHYGCLDAWCISFCYLQACLLTKLLLSFGSPTPTPFGLGIHFYLGFSFFFFFCSLFSFLEMVLPFVFLHWLTSYTCRPISNLGPCVLGADS